MPTKKSRVLRFAVSAALIGAGPLAACGGSEPHVNEPAEDPEPIHVNEPAQDPVEEPVGETSNEPPQEPEEPDGPTTNEPAPD
jgi:hypothetical protein